MNKIVRVSVEKILRYLGYELIPSWRIRNLDFAHHLAAIFEQLKIQCILDVGANVGRYTRFLRNQVGYDGLIISFEPTKKCVDTLRELAKKDHQWIVYDYALGSKNEKQAINVMQRDVFSSFLKPDLSIVKDEKFKKENVIDHKEIVEVKKLDSIIEMLKSKHSITNMYLKMDTQGYDLEVIGGAEKTLDEVLALQSEVSTRKIYENMPNFYETLLFLEQKGFDITGMYPVSRDQMLRVVDFDCVMINRSVAQKVQYAQETLEA